MLISRCVADILIMNGSCPVYNYCHFNIRVIWKMVWGLYYNYAVFSLLPRLALPTSIILQFLVFLKLTDMLWWCFVCLFVVSRTWTSTDLYSRRVTISHVNLWARHPLLWSVTQEMTHSLLRLTQHHSLLFSRHLLTPHPLTPLPLTPLTQSPRPPASPLKGWATNGSLRRLLGYLIHPLRRSGARWLGVRPLTSATRDVTAGNGRPWWRLRLLTAQHSCLISPVACLLSDPVPGLLDTPPFN